MSTPPLFSTLSAITELFVTAAVFWFFYKALKHQDYRWGIITVAVVYETLFNITYMVTRLAAHTAPSDNPTWYIVFVAFHGTLSLIMFLGLITLLVWAHHRQQDGEADPLGTRRGLAWTFLALWTVSILTGEIIYLLHWTDLVGPS